MHDFAAVEALARAGRMREAHALAVAACAQGANDASWWRLRAQLASALDDHADVARGCEQLVRLAPSDPAAWFNLGVAHRALGDADAAAGALRQALALAPEHAGAHAELGGLLHEGGEAAAAAPHLHTAARAMPHRPDVAFESGMVQLELGQFDDAQASFSRVLQLQPGYGPALMFLGDCHLARGRLDAARECFTRACRATPPVPEACRRLGRLYAQTGRLDEAVATLREALQAMPDDVETRVFLANALAASQAGPRAIGEAGQLLRQAVALAPAEPAPRLALGDLLLSQGLHEDAMEHLEAVLSRDPEHAAAGAARARVLERQRDYPAALAAIEPLLARHPRDADVALAYAAIAPRVGHVEQALAHLEGIEDAGIDPARRQELLFARAALRDRLADYEGAFEDFAAANRLTPAPDGAGTTEAAVDALIDAHEDLIREHDAARVAARPRARNRSGLPVFIVGMPRSGTTLVEQVLASHPAVYGAGELSAMRGIAMSLPTDLGRSEQYPKCAHALVPPLLDHIAERHLQWLQEMAPGAERITDKMPHNFRWLGLVDQLFPAARVIHCVRDPRDTCLSIWFQPFSPGHPYAADLRALGRYYRQYQRLMSHWRAVLALPILELRYEDMVEQHESTVRRLVEFCNLPWDDRCLRFYEHGRAVNTPSQDQVRRPIYRESLGRWRNYVSHLAPLEAGLGTDAA